MKAVLMKEVNHLEFVDVENPQPKDDEVLLKIMAVGVCGSDIPRILKYGSHVLPIIPGHEFAGEVISYGKNVHDWKVGDKAAAAPLIPCNECEWCKKGIYSLCEKYRYYGSRNNGAFAQYLAVKEHNLIKISEDTPYDWGATIDPAANALHAFFRADVQKEDTICVFGMGAIGLFAIQYAKALGIKTIIAVDVNDEKLSTAMACGATPIIQSMKEDAVEKVWQYTDGKGVSVSFDMSGVPIAQQQAILVTGKMGRVVYLGISHEGLNLSEKAVDNILRFQLSLMGSWNSFSNPFPGREWTEVAELMADKKLDPSLLISHRLKLDQMPDVFKKIEKKEILFNKIMFYPNGMEQAS